MFDGVEVFKLAESGNFEESLRLCSERLTENCDDSLAMFIAAYAMSKASKWGIAYNLLQRAVQLSPQRHEIHNNLGNCCINMQRFEEAEKHIRKAIQLSPMSRPGLNNLALLKVYDCKPDEALHWAKKSLDQDINQWDVSETYGYASMMLEQWEEGWKGYERMIGHSKARPWKPVHDEPKWDGTPGKTVHIRGEQGIGDEISFASILPDAMKDVKIVFECDHKLEGLFKRSFPGLEIHGTRFEGSRDWAKGYDYFSLLGSLAQFYRKKSEDFPGDPYLVADEERRLQWKVILDRLPVRKIGIAWSGGLKNTFRARRSITLETLLPLLRTPGVTWVSLQYQDPSEEIGEFEAKHGIKIHHWKRASESRDYDDVAALVSELDSVVSVTTAVIHLCGALGKECHVMVPSKPRWFYGLKGDQSRWYKSVKLHRQKGKDWNSVVHGIQQTLFPTGSSTTSTTKESLEAV